MDRQYLTQGDKNYQKVKKDYLFYFHRAVRYGQRVNYIQQAGWDYTLPLESVTVVAGWLPTGSIIVTVENRAIGIMYTYRYRPNKPGRPITFVTQRI